MTLHPFIWTSLLTAVVTGCLAVLIISRNQHLQLIRAYALYELSIAFWSFFTSIHLFSDSAAVSLHCSRVMHLGVAFIPVLFLHFTLVLLDSVAKHKVLLRVGYTISVLFAVTSFTPLMVPSVRPKLGFAHFMDGGPVYPFLIAFFAIYVAIGHGFLFKTFITSKGKKRTQYRLLFFSSLIGYIFGSASFFPVYNIDTFPYPYGNLGIVVYSLIAVYAIYRYQFSNSELVIKRTIVFVGLFISIYLALTVCAVAGRKIFQEFFGIDQWVWSSLLIFIVMLIYEPLRNLLVNITDKYLFQKQVDYKSLIKSYHDDVMTQLDLDKIIEGTRSAIMSTMRPDHYGLYLLDFKTDKYVLQEAGAARAYRPDSPLVARMKERGDVLLYASERFGPAGPVMEADGIVVAIPFLFRDDFFGFILMGKKRNEEEYIEDDLDILRTLSKACSMALINATRNTNLIHIKVHKELRRMADKMSHQVKNRFAGIRGLMELMSADAPLDLQSGKDPVKVVAEILQAVERAKLSADRGLDLCKKFLDHSRHQSEGFKVQSIVPPAETGLMMVSLNLEGFAEIRQISNIQQGLPPIWSNWGMIEEIFSTTAHNSYDAIMAKKRSIKDSYEPCIEIHIEHKPEAGVIHIEIKDNGLGMKPHDLEAVNSGVPYFTTKASSEEKSGNGVGVHAVRDYVHAHGGILRYESKYLEGCACIIDLPVRAEPTNGSGGYT